MCEGEGLWAAFGVPTLQNSHLFGPLIFHSPHLMTQVFLLSKPAYVFASAWLKYLINKNKLYCLRYLKKRLGFVVVWQTMSMVSEAQQGWSKAEGEAGAPAGLPPPSGPITPTPALKAPQEHLKLTYN